MVSVLSVAWLWAAMAAQTHATGLRKLLPFDYKGVRVTGGMLRAQLDEAKNFYLRIPNDDLLLGFRRRAGLPAPGHELGGWYSDDVFHIFGQILSGLSRMYGATGDEACREKANALLDGWVRCIAPDGFFYWSNKPNAPHYTYDKMVGGLVDMMLYCGRRDAATPLARITTWAETHLDRTNEYAHNAGEGSTEWYTLSENLYRAFITTGDTRYRDFAKVWEYTEYWQLYAQNKDIFGPRPGGPPQTRYHAYSHVNNLGGAALAYRVRGDQWYLDTLEHAYDYLRGHQCFATGGFGPDESLVDPKRLEGMLEDTDATFETQCGSWAVFKLCKHLISLTGDGRYGDWAEQVAYNGLGATPPLPAAGNVFYYSNYNPFGAVKRQGSVGWSCCAGTRPMALADVADVIYFRAPDGICTNLFVPSTVTFEANSAPITVRQETRFPEEPRTSFEFHLGIPNEFAFRIRKPSWLAGEVTADVNGVPATISPDDHGWLSMQRVWRDGDRLNVSLPMAFHSAPLYAGKPYPTAISVGPVVLAFRSDKGNPVAKVDLAHLTQELMASPGEPLTYHLKGDDDVLARPFYAYKEGEEYFMYLEPAAIGRISHYHLRTNGPWHDSGNHYYCNAPGSWCEGDFEGESVTLLGFKYDDGGRGEVTIDGKLIDTIDEYAPARDIPAQWTYKDLGPGKHKIRVTVRNEKSPESKDIYMNVAGLRISQ